LNITRQILRIFQEAENEANKSNVHKAAMSAILTDKKYRTIYAKSHNRNYYGSKVKFSIHAEESLISSYRKHFDNKVLIIYRKASYGYGCSKPCKKCMKLIKIAEINNIAYFNKCGDFIEEKINA